MFSEKEIDYLKSKPHARIATVASESNQPDVVPVGFDFDGEYFYVGGLNILKSTKYRNVLKNNKVALVIDDVKTVGDPSDVRGIKIYGIADIIDRKGGYMEGAHNSGSTHVYIWIKPKKKWSWGIDGPVFLEGMLLE